MNILSGCNMHGKIKMSNKRRSATNKKQLRKSETGHTTRRAIRERNRRKYI